MIKLHTKKTHTLNYCLFEVNDLSDVNSISDYFSNKLKAEPLFSSSGIIRDKAYVLIGTSKAIKRSDFTDPRPKKIFQSSIIKSKSNSLFYLCNFKKNVIDDFLIPLLNNLINLDVESTFIKAIPKEKPIINLFKSPRIDVNEKINILVPYFIKNVFSDYFDSPVFSNISEEIPVIVMNTINKEASHQINSNNFLKVKKFIGGKSLGRVINYSNNKNQLFFSVENNESAWNIINGLKYSLFHKEFLQVTHYLDMINDARYNEVMMQWNILVTGIPKEWTYMEIFNEYGKIEGEKDKYKQIINIEIREEDEKTNNAYIQFLKFEDADELWRKDPKKIKINYLSMNLKHFQDSKELIKELFPKSSFAIEKVNNSDRARPIFQVFFDSKEDLTDALFMSGMIEKKPPIPSDLLERTSNKEYQYKLSLDIKRSIYTNYLRAFCFAYRPNSVANKLENPLTKQLQKRNTIRILDVDDSVRLDDVIDALAQNEYYTDSITFFGNSVIVTLHQKRDADQILKNVYIEIAGNEYEVEPFTSK